MLRSKNPEFKDIDHMQLFEQIDVDGNGLIDKEEFEVACENMHVDELVSIARSLGRNELSMHKGKEEAKAESFGKLVVDRLAIMLDVAVSKIFPAGFGWQSASVVAGNLGFAGNSLPFFVCTGFGDFAGVLIGHTGFKALYSAVGYDVNLKKEAQTGLLLGSAAFFSGFAWQPILNTCNALNMGFSESAFWVCTGCTLAFYAGLRVFRTVYGSAMDMEGVEAPSYANLKADWGLSISIGGATGAFVGTDVSFGAGNWLRPLVGIEDGTPDLVGSVIAGSSTALGFCAFQTIQSVSVPKGKCWVD